MVLLEKAGVGVGFDENWGSGRPSHTAVVPEAGPRHEVSRGTFSGARKTGKMGETWGYLYE